MIRNQVKLVLDNPIVDMIGHKKTVNGMSCGLSEVGYDICVKERIEYHAADPKYIMTLMNKMWTYGIDYPMTEEDNQKLNGYTVVTKVDDEGNDISSVTTIGRTALASSVEEFQIPNTLWAEFKNKSTLAREFIDAAIGTDGEPGWKGFLTIEIVFHSSKSYTLKEGSPILKAVFHQVETPVTYVGKYQNQSEGAVEAKYE